MDAMQQATMKLQMEVDNKITDFIVQSVNLCGLERNIKVNAVMIREAIERSKARRPDSEWRYTTLHHWCPSCENEVEKDRDDWCPSCGQHLLWDEELS